MTSGLFRKFADFFKTFSVVSARSMSTSWVCAISEELVIKRAQRQSRFFIKNVSVVVCKKLSEIVRRVAGTNKMWELVQLPAQIVTIRAYKGMNFRES